MNTQFNRLAIVLFTTGVVTSSAFAAWKDTIKLINDDQEEVTIEVRMGQDGDPVRNPSLGSRTVGPGKYWAIECSTNVWYRRTNGDGAWLDVACYGLGKVVDETIR